MLLEHAKTLGVEARVVTDTLGPLFFATSKICVYVLIAQKTKTRKSQQAQLTVRLYSVYTTQHFGPDFKVRGGEKGHGYEDKLLLFVILTPM